MERIRKWRYIKKWRHIYIEKTARLFYPPVCPLCQKILRENEGMAHPSCLSLLVEVGEPKCKRCGKPILSEQAQFCRDCYTLIQKMEAVREPGDNRKSVFSHNGFDQNAALWIYEGSIRQAVLDYKYSGMRAYTDFFVTRLAAVYGWWIKSKDPQLLIPVPVHARKKRARGYNQAELLADGLSELTGIPVTHDLLVRAKYTDPQKTLTPTERRKNLEKVMIVYPDRIDAIPKRVIIIDDIYTTGSTLDACASVLKKAGVLEVYGLTLCIGDTGRGR